MAKIELSAKDLRLLQQSLEHCVATCHQKAAGGGPCEDCEAALQLLARLKALTGNEAKV